MTCLGLPYVPDDVWNKVASNLPVRDIVALSMTSRQLRDVMREYRPTNKTPIFTNQDGVREVWKYLPFGMEYPHCSRVSSVFVSGNYLYTGCFDNNASKIDINTGETLMEYPHKKGLNSVFVSGDYLYTGDDKKARKFPL